MYISVDDIFTVIRKTGRLPSLGKINIKQAYHNVPVSLGNRTYLGMRWDGQVFMDRVLLFGIPSASLIFTTIADALQWAIKQVNFPLQI